MFLLGHGHFAQFQNFQDCAPPEIASRSTWTGLQGFESGSQLAKVRAIPHNMRWHLNSMWHAKQGLIGLPRGAAVFYTGDVQVDTLRLLHGYRKYYYIDLTSSLLRDMSPWYDHMRKSGSVATAKDMGYRATVQQFDGVFAMSRWTAAGVSRDYALPANRVHIALPGANLQRWHYVDRSNRTGPVRILMVGGEFARKGGPLLLDWAANTTARNWELDIVTWPGELPDWARACMGNPGSFDSAAG